MKKLTLSCITIILMLYIPIAKLSAQENTVNSFSGAWELTQLSANGSGSRTVIPGLIKFFNPDGKFFNMRITKNGSVITHQGSYFINDAQTYSEVITSEIKGSYYALAGKTYKLRYRFSDDKKLLTLSGLVEGKDGVENLTFTEVWKKIEVVPVNPV